MNYESRGEVNPLETSLRLQELVYGLEIRKVMTSEVITVSRQTSMREAQALMKQNAITGLPVTVAESQKVVGLVSMNDVMNALEKGKMEDTVLHWMTREVQVLHDEMPLSFAIAAFNKYPFRRFPVVDKDNKLNGMLTFRNINLALIRELSQQLNKMEHLIEDSEEADIFDLVKVYSLQQHDFENGGKASTEIKKFLKRRKVPSGVIRRVAVACYELEINLVAHSLGGMLGFDINPERIRISANDLGPGIENIKLAMTEGFSTASEWVRSMGFGAGMGLPNVKKISDEFEIHSEPGLGTMILSIIYLKKENGKEGNNDDC